MTLITMTTDNYAQHGNTSYKDIDHYDNQHNDIQHSDIQHNDTQHKAILCYDILHIDTQRINIVVIVLAEASSITKFRIIQLSIMTLTKTTLDKIL